MYELKTNKNRASVTAYLQAIEDGRRRADARKLVAMMRSATGRPPRMWGSSIVGFGLYHYEYATGHKGAWPIVGFAPRKRDFTLYIMSGFSKFGPLLARLGKHKIGKSCLYIKSLGDVDQTVLMQLITKSVELMRMNYATE